MPPTPKTVRLRSPAQVTKLQAVRAAGRVQALATALGITADAVRKWGKYPPQARQAQIIEIFGEKQ